MDKTLVIYFSAQGHTRAIAQNIAISLGADIFEIKPAQVYTEDDLVWMDPDARCSREHDDEPLRDIELTDVTLDLAEYNKVIIAYPIWWGIAAWATNSFLKKIDLNDKKVFPVAVSHSSPLGDSDILLRADANGGDWQPGKRFSQDASTKEIAEWCANL